MEDKGSIKIRVKKEINLSFVSQTVSVRNYSDTIFQVSIHYTCASLTILQYWSYVIFRAINITKGTGEAGGKSGRGLMNV